MNQLGVNLAWLGVQVTLVLIPVLALHARAAQRSPEMGAWVASFGLGLVLVLSVAAWLPGLPKTGESTPSTEERTEATIHSVPESFVEPLRSAMRVGRSLSGLKLVWARLEQGTAEPALRCRPWGGPLAVIALGGTVVGLLHYGLGLWAVGACRRRSKDINDPEMCALLEDLRGALSVRDRVTLRENAELTGPATAGYWRPVILLPDDWRTWNEGERRAVLAHELAHVVRGDYAAGLLARLAIALNFLHPLVRWTAGRLRLQQELAADALGARHAGGRDAYLVALSRLALRQEGRSISGPARAFLPARGTLIRRINMLRNESRTLPPSQARRVPAALFLVAITAAIATLRGPARGGEDDPAVKQTATTSPRVEASSSPLRYVRGGMNGFVMLRPALAVRHPDAARLASLYGASEGLSYAALAKMLKVDMSRPDFRWLQPEDIEWITVNLGFDVPAHLKSQKDSDGKPLHRMVFGISAIRTVAPFDWLAFLRQWGLKFEKASEGKREFYKITGPLKAMIGPNPCVYLPDDRTIVPAEEAELRELIREGEAVPPNYLRGKDWERASQGILAVAINNENGSFAKTYDLGRPDDAMVLSLMNGVDHWIFGVADSQALCLHATAPCRDDATEGIARAVDSLLKLCRAELDKDVPGDKAEEPAFRMAKALLNNLRVRKVDGSIDIRAEDFGTFGDLASIVGDLAKSPRSDPKKTDKP
jgi:beta-lactamase regulating signal transducer with metallopeptidase domain